MPSISQTAKAIESEERHFSKTHSLDYLLTSMLFKRNSLNKQDIKEILKIVLKGEIFTIWFS